MTKITDLHRRWSKDANYKEAYNALPRANADRGADCGGAVAVAARPAHEDIAVLHRAHRGRHGASIDGCVGALRASDSYASADRLRVVCFAIGGPTARASGST